MNSHLILLSVLESPAAVLELLALTRTILYVFLAAAFEDPTKDGPVVAITLLIPPVELITRVVVVDVEAVEDIGDGRVFVGDNRAPIFAPAVPNEMK